MIKRRRAAVRKKRIEDLDKQIEALQAERELHAQALAELLTEYHPGDVLRKEGSQAGLWLVEGVALCSYNLDQYSVQARKLKKDGTLSKITTGFDSRYDLNKCTLHERRKP